ncbi:hypothetical protein AQUCO_01400865v1 [Aquilegia coerulea]|uniref:Late embryogenesis abundant protein LEA-2 subgroup domain-containing protein n=1 Tax=Aquilegia coerulea TaxID=218851 RepID=A0A2G5DZ65_AQUCA|nr:hypothetical protein AQUCO_01400865v1 [Aquilegia coerulea]
MDIEAAPATAPATASPSVFRRHWRMCCTLGILLLVMIIIYAYVNLSFSKYKPKIELDSIRTNGSSSDHFGPSTVVLASLSIENTAARFLEYDFMVATLEYNNYVISSFSMQKLHQKPKTLIMIRASFTEFDYIGNVTSLSATVKLFLHFRVKGLSMEFTRVVKISCGVKVASWGGSFTGGIDDCVYF